MLAVASDSGAVLCYDAGTGKLLQQYQDGSPVDGVQALAFDPAGQYMVSAGSDQMFRIWA